MTTKMTKNITENINKTGIITKKITSLFIPICLLLISFSLVNCPDPGNGNGNGGGQTEVPPQIKVEHRVGVPNKDALQDEFLLSLNSKPAGDVTVNITTSRSDGGTATVKLKDSTDAATEMLTVTFTNENWNTPQEIELAYKDSGNTLDQPDQFNVKITFNTTSGDDTAYNDLTYIVSGNLTPPVPNFRIHVHNAQSPEPEGAAGTDDRNIKVWFSLEPSIASIDQAEACATAGGLWSYPYCIVTPEETCKKAYGNDAWDSASSTCGSITAEFACNNIHGDWDSANNICNIDASNACGDSGNSWDSLNLVCGRINPEDACLATTGNKWVDVSGTDTCQSSGGSTVTAKNACEATSGNVWNSTTEACGFIGAEDACATTLYGTWDSANARCVVLPEKACNEARGVWDSNNPTCSIAADLACDTAEHTWINKADPVCAITNPQSHDSDITITYTLTAETASAGDDYTAPATTPEETTVTIPASKTSAYIEIPLVADVKAVSGTTPADEGDETFKVSITSASTPGANLSVVDADATVTIGDPNETSNYFFPNRPLMRGEKAETATTPTAGDTPYFECYLVPGTGVMFGNSTPYIKFANSTGATPIAINNSGDADSSIVNLAEYRAETSSPLLAFSSSRPFIRVFFAPDGSGYDPSNNYLYTCVTTFLNGSATPVKSGSSGRFGMLEFGQAYEYK